MYATRTARPNLYCVNGCTWAFSNTVPCIVAIAIVPGFPHTSQSRLEVVIAGWNSFTLLTGTESYKCRLNNRSQWVPQHQCFIFDYIAAVTWEGLLVIKEKFLCNHSGGHYIAVYICRGLSSMRLEELSTFDSPTQNIAPPISSMDVWKFKKGNLASQQHCLIIEKVWPTKFLTEEHLPSPFLIHSNFPNIH